MFFFLLLDFLNVSSFYDFFDVFHFSFFLLLFFGFFVCFCVCVCFFIFCFFADCASRAGRSKKNMKK